MAKMRVRINGSNGRTIEVKHLVNYATSKLASAEVLRIDVGRNRFEKLNGRIVWTHYTDKGWIAVDDNVKAVTTPTVKDDCLFASTRETF